MENKANKYLRDYAYFTPEQLQKVLLDGYILQSVQHPTIIIYLEKRQNNALLVGMEISWSRDGQKSLKLIEIKSVLIIISSNQLLEIFESGFGRLYNILYCDEYRFYDAYQRLKKCTPLISEGLVSKPHPLHKPIEVDVLNGSKKDSFERSMAYSMGVQMGDIKPEPVLTFANENDTKESAMLANAELMQNAFLLTRRVGHTTAMFKAWLRHIQHHADRVVIVAANHIQEEELRRTERVIVQQLRDEYWKRTEPNFFRSCLISLGLAKYEYYKELGELHIVPMHKLSRFIDGNKSIIVFDNAVFLDLHSRK